MPQTGSRIYSSRLRRAVSIVILILIAPKSTMIIRPHHQIGTLSVPSADGRVVEYSNDVIEDSELNDDNTTSSPDRDTFCSISHKVNARGCCCQVGLRSVKMSLERWHCDAQYFPKWLKETHPTRCSVRGADCDAQYFPKWLKEIQPTRCNVEELIQPNTSVYKVLQCPKISLTSAS
jgi:hypothetical protein